MEPEKTKKLSVIEAKINLNQSLFSELVDPVDLAQYENCRKQIKLLGSPEQIKQLQIFEEHIDLIRESNRHPDIKKLMAITVFQRIYALADQLDQDSIEEARFGAVSVIQTKLESDTPKEQRPLEELSAEELFDLVKAAIDSISIVGTNQTKSATARRQEDNFIISDDGRGFAGISSGMRAAIMREKAVINNEPNKRIPHLTLAYMLTTDGGFAARHMFSAPNDDERNKLFFAKTEKEGESIILHIGGSIANDGNIGRTANTTLDIVFKKEEGELANRLWDFLHHGEVEKIHELLLLLCTNLLGLKRHTEPTSRNDQIRLDFISRHVFIENGVPEVRRFKAKVKKYGLDG